MDLLFGLATVDKMQDDRLARQLARGWLGWESQTLRRVRALVARTLVAAAARLDPAQVRQLISDGRAAEAPAA